MQCNIKPMYVISHLVASVWKVLYLNDHHELIIQWNFFLYIPQNANRKMWSQLKSPSRPLAELSASSPLVFGVLNWGMSRSIDLSTCSMFSNVMHYYFSVCPQTRIKRAVFVCSPFIIFHETNTYTISILALTWEVLGPEWDSIVNLHNYPCNYL